MRVFLDGNCVSCETVWDEDEGTVANKYTECSICNDVNCLKCQTPGN